MQSCPPSPFALAQLLDDERNKYLLLTALAGIAGAFIVLVVTEEEKISKPTTKAVA